MGKAPESLKEKNKGLAHPNRELIFRGCIEVPFISRGQDGLYLKVLFSDGVAIREFNPDLSVRRRSLLATRWGYLCEALGLDFNDIPFCHDYESFVATFIDFTAPKKGTLVYAKLTVDEDGWLILGTDKCFSDRPDMEYSDEDRENLDTDLMDEQNRMQTEPPY